MAKTQLMEFVLDDIEKQKGVAIPVRASLLERLIVTSASCKSIHPNPEDEFSIESVGPSYRIIGEYQAKFRDAMRMGSRPFDEPLMVEKLRPHGYLLLNGHHRWAGVIRACVPTIRIQVVDP